jgi:UDP-GlcNAc3NAcA epimerase
MKLVSVVGARPQFIKLAPLARAFSELRQPGGPMVEHIVVHTGQHYDWEMSDVFFEELDLPAPAVHLGVGSASHGAQTGRMLEGLEQALLAMQPDVVAVYGDTNSTLAGALAASKVGVLLAHIEAGLRSFDRRMPEEVNRIVADHLADLLLAPTPTAMANLEREGIAERSCFTGDLMYDAALAQRALSNGDPPVLERLGLTAGDYAVATLHRAQNTDDAGRLASVIEALTGIAADRMPVVFPIHPRTSRLVQSTLTGWQAHPRLRLTEPLGYRDMLALVSRARLVLTDSGGVQREAFFLGCPCVTLRDETEWLETLQAGGNILAGTEPARVLAAVAAWDDKPVGERANFLSHVPGAFGDGHAAERIRDSLLALAEAKTEREPTNTFAEER